MVLRLACAWFHSRFIHRKGYREGIFLPQNTQKRPSGDTEEAGERCASHDSAAFPHHNPRTLGTSCRNVPKRNPALNLSCLIERLDVLLSMVCFILFEFVKYLPIM